VDSFHLFNRKISDRVREKKTSDKQKELWKQSTCVTLPSRSTAMNHGRILHTLLCEYFYIPLQSLRHTKTAIPSWHT